MYRKILVTGVTAAAIVGAGATALAATGDSSTAGTPTGTSSSSTAKSGAHGKHAGKGKLLRRAVHGEIVTKGKDGFVTHDIINGTVTSVSSSSITVAAADKTSETFGVTSDTKVRARTDGKGAASSIDKVKSGDHVLVLGTGTSTKTAKHIVDLGTK